MGHHQARFEPFPQLPPEVQDRIWALALEIYSSAAHFASIEKSIFRVTGGYPMKLVQSRNSSSRISSPATRRVADILLQTCQRSRAAVLRRRRRRAGMGPHPLELTEREARQWGFIDGSYSPPPPSAEQAAAAARLPGLTIDDLSDLVVLDEDWRVPGKIMSFRPTIKGLRNLAVPWCPVWGGGERDHTRQHLRIYHLLEAFLHVEVYYAVLDPSDLAAARDSHATTTPAFERYLESNYRRDDRRGPFYGGGREYYELSPENVAELGPAVGQLALIFQDVGDRRENHLDYLSKAACGRPFPWTRGLVFRFMSWRPEREGDAVIPPQHEEILPAAVGHREEVPKS